MLLRFSKLLEDWKTLEILERFNIYKYWNICITFGVPHLVGPHTCIEQWCPSEAVNQSIRAQLVQHKTNASTSECLQAFWLMKAVSRLLDILLVIDLLGQDAVLWKCCSVNRGHGCSQLTFQNRPSFWYFAMEVCKALFPSSPVMSLNKSSAMTA